MVCLTNFRFRPMPMPPKLNRKRALFVLTKIDEILAWEKTERGRARYPFRRTRQVPVRGAGGTVLAGGEVEVVRRLSGKAISGVEKEGILSDVHSRAPAAGDQEGSQGNRLDERKGVGEAGAGGRVSDFDCAALGAQSPLHVDGSSSGGRWRRN